MYLDSDNITKGLNTHYGFYINIMSQEMPGEHLYVIFTCKPDSVEPTDLEMAVCPRIVDIIDRKGHTHLRDMFMKAQAGNRKALTGGAIVPGGEAYLVSELSSDVKELSLTKEQFMEASKRMWLYDGTTWESKDASVVLGNNLEKIV